MQNTINVTERLNALMVRRNIDLTKNVRFKKLRTIKWDNYLAASKQEAIMDWND